MDNKESKPDSETSSPETPSQDYLKALFDSKWAEMDTDARLSALLRMVGSLAEVIGRMMQQIDEMDLVLAFLLRQHAAMMDPGTPSNSVN